MTSGVGRTKLSALIKYKMVMGEFLNKRVTKNNAYVKSINSTNPKHFIQTEKFWSAPGPFILTSELASMHEH